MSLHGDNVSIPPEPPSEGQSSTIWPMTGRARRILRILLLVALTVGLIGSVAVAAFVFVAWRAMPDMESLMPKYVATSFIYDRDGQEVTGLAGPENRIPVSLAEISEPVRQAFVAHEDRYFYDHHGVVLRAVVRALYANVTGKPVQGGSTITQQLARTAFLTLDRTLTRKVQEAIVAIKMERVYSKDEILAMYLNQINLGHGAYGVEAAARNFFGKSAAELNLAEAALMAGIAKSPGNLSPYRNLAEAKEHQRVVLNQMARQGFINGEEAAAAAGAELILPGLSTRTDYPYPFFIDYVVDQLINVYKMDTELIYSGGLAIHTTLDVATQAAAEAAVAKYSVNFPTNRAGERAELGMVIMENATGYLRAIVGGVEHKQHLQFNFATQAKRQPGSAFKPIVDYTPAIDLGYSPATVVDDAPAVWTTSAGESWQPVNYDGRFRGLVTFRYALERSINVPAAKVLSMIGVKTGLSYAQRMGIDNLVTSGTRNDATWSLAIGALTYGVSSLEMTRAYAVLGNQGVKVEPLAVLRVVDATGRVILENQPKLERVLSEQTAWLVTDMLVGVINQSYATGTRARLPGWTAAGKTGTSDNYADAWFAGYTAVNSGAVWLGYPKERASMGVQFGGMYPALIWKEAMIAAHRDTVPVGFERPADILQATVCRKSGKLPGPNCPPGDLITDYFRKGTEPTETCAVHVTARVIAANPGYYLAPPDAPPEVAVWRTFIVRPQPASNSAWQLPTPGTAPLPDDAGQELPIEYFPEPEPTPDPEPEPEPEPEPPVKPG